jgi:hypothetical protein
MTMAFIVWTVLWVLMAAVCAHALILARWCRRWGTTAAERQRVMSGDALIGRPTYEATLAVTIEAPPDCIWPWLVQMGYQRGGLYSYDWLDRWFGYLDRPSATHIMPEFQHLEAGDEIPIGRGLGFPVRAVEQNRTLLLAGVVERFRWTWEFALYPIDGQRTRLVSRNRARVSRTLRDDLFMAVLEPAAFIMTRKMLLGIKQRAESLAREAPRSLPLSA